MKTKRAAHAGTLWLISAIVVAIPVVVASAQSGRVQTPPTISISPSHSSPSQSGVESSYVPDPNADKYKLIFARGYEGKRSYKLNKPKDIAALVQATRSELDNFVEQLNKDGAQGYKLLSAIYGGLAVGIVKFDGVQYEYDWVMTDSIFSVLSGGHDEYERLSKRGFRLVDHFEITFYCHDDVSSPGGGEYCETKDLFLLEKKKGVEKPTPYVLVYPSGSWRGPISTWLTDQVKQKLAEGFFPTKLLSQYGILVEQTEKKDERFTDKQDVRVVTGSAFWGGFHSISRINELAKHGYRLALLNNRIALMYKDGETATPVTYVWLHTTTKKNWKLEPRKRKDFEEKLANLQASGAVYRMIYRDNQGYSKLIFEQRALNDSKRREYRVLTFEFHVDVDAAAQKVNIDLAPASKGTIKMLNSLAKDGFVVRDLFASDKYSVVLERTP